MAMTASVPPAPIPASPQSNALEDGGVGEATSTMVGVRYDRRLGLMPASLASADRESVDSIA